MRAPVDGWTKPLLTLLGSRQSPPEIVDREVVVELKSNVVMVQLSALKVVDLVAGVELDEATSPAIVADSPLEWVRPGGVISEDLASEMRVENET